MPGRDLKSFFQSYNLVMYFFDLAVKKLVKWAVNKFVFFVDLSRMYGGYTW